MKRVAHQLANQTGFIAVAVSLLVSIVLAGISHADAVDTCQPIAVKAINVESLEVRIEVLHEKLKITQAQEELWNNVTEVMRQSAQTMATIFAKIKSRNTNTGTPVDDIKSYSQVADAHANSVKKFIPVFEAFYNDLSDAQKKTIEEAGLEF